MKTNNFLKLDAELIVKTMESMKAGRNADLIPSTLRRYERRLKRIRRPDLKARHEALIHEFGIASASQVRHARYFHPEDFYDPDEQIDPKKTNNFLRLDAELLIRTMESMKVGRNADLIPGMLHRYDSRFKRIRRPDLKLRYGAIIREFGYPDYMLGSSGSSA